MTASIDRLIGKVLAARYRVGERLGAGAMGTVFRAEHVKVGRAFAIKVLHPRMLEHEKYRKRFDREAELAGKLSHPNVVGVVDVGITPDSLRYLVMELANGPTLATIIHECAPLPPARVIHLARQLCAGLAHAHEHGLIHRDFKPENVVVERDAYGTETARILDFGIAITLEDTLADERARLTTAGMVLGTPHYMAPEHASGKPIDHRIDLFALGVICFEMICGRLPFDGDGVEVARANLTRATPAMRTRVPSLEVDPLLEAFTRALMARSRDARLPSAKAAHDLLDLIERDPPAASRVLGIRLHQRRTLPAAAVPAPHRPASPLHLDLEPLDPTPPANAPSATAVPAPPAAAADSVVAPSAPASVVSASAFAPSADAASVGASSVATSSVGAASADTSSAGVWSARASSVSASPVGASPVGASPVGASPVGASPVGASPVLTWSPGASSVAASSAAASPAVAWSAGAPSIGTSSVLASTIGASSAGSSPVGASSVGAPSELTSTIGAPSELTSTIGAPSELTSTIGASSVGASSVGASSVGASSELASAIGASSVGASSVGASWVAASSVAASSVAALSVSVSPMAASSAGASSVDASSAIGDSLVTVAAPRITVVDLEPLGDIDPPQITVVDPPRVTIVDLLPLEPDDPSSSVPFELELPLSSTPTLAMPALEPSPSPWAAPDPAAPSLEPDEPTTAARLLILPDPYRDPAPAPAPRDTQRVRPRNRTLLFALFGAALAAIAILAILAIPPAAAPAPTISLVATPVPSTAAVPAVAPPAPAVEVASPAEPVAVTRPSEIPAAAPPAVAPTAAHLPPEASSPPAPVAAAPPAPTAAAPRRAAPARPRAAPVPAAVAAAAPEPTAAVIAELYGTIGRSLKRLDVARGQAATQDLWPRYRLIRINEAIAETAKRLEANALLEALEREIAVRSGT